VCNPAGEEWKRTSGKGINESTRGVERGGGGRHDEVGRGTGRRRVLERMEKRRRRKGDKGVENNCGNAVLKTGRKRDAKRERGPVVERQSQNRLLFMDRAALGRLHRDSFYTMSPGMRRPYLVSAF